MKKITKKQFNVECIKLKSKSIAFKKRITRFCRKHEKLRKEFINVISKIIKAGEEASAAFDNDLNDLSIVIEGSKHGINTREFVPGVYEYAKRYLPWPILKQNLEEMITRISDLALLPGLEKFVLKS